MCGGKCTKRVALCQIERREIHAGMTLERQETRVPRQAVLYVHLQVHTYAVSP